MRWMKSLLFNDAAADRLVSNTDACIYDTDGENSKEPPSVENPSMICMPCILNGDPDEQATVANHDSRDPIDSQGEWH